MAPGMVSLPVRVACGDKLIVDAEIKVPVVATVTQNDAIQVQVSADMLGLRKALARFFYHAAETVESAEFDNPVDCHSAHSSPTPLPIEQMVNSLLGTGKRA